MVASCACYRPSFTRRATGQRSRQDHRPFPAWRFRGSVGAHTRQTTAQLGQRIVETRPALRLDGTAAVISPPDGHTFGLVFDYHAEPVNHRENALRHLKDLASVMVSTAAMAIVAHEK
jgi:hypothetical protein